jgi:hypothetical protein
MFGPEQERPFDQKRALVVKEVVPPSRRYELGKQHRDEVVGTLVVRELDIFQQGLHDRAEWDARISRRMPFPHRDPVLANFLGRLRIDVDVDGAHVVGERAGILERLDHRAVNTADRPR